MAVKVATKPDRRYLKDRDGVFRPLENLSITSTTPAYPAVLHKTRRTMILADDHAHSVVSLDKDMLVRRNAELSAVLIAYEEPTAATWKALEEHMARESLNAAMVKEAKSKALQERKRKAAEQR